MENGRDVDIVIKAGEVGHPLLSTNQLNKMGYSTILGGDAPHLHHRGMGADIPIHEVADQLLYVIMNVRVWQSDELNNLNKGTAETRPTPFTRPAGR